ncbi:uncharacterized protein LOC120291689 [Eucalyptus grandis]|uniref:uncharacterized protein LOC120291689 n=1 Tax=Eucalyptus grandis TaxID=71139 RepID=UPI00192EAB06|nr:uncharacterized protein LOC120291689 [Eucalyptus grandis]
MSRSYGASSASPPGGSSSSTTTQAGHTWHLRRRRPLAGQIVAHLAVAVLRPSNLLRSFRRIPLSIPQLRSPSPISVVIQSARVRVRSRPSLELPPAIPHEMAGPSAYRSLAPKTKNLVVAGGLTAFVFGVYFYTMRAVGGSDELQTAIDKFEEQKSKQGA